MTQPHTHATHPAIIKCLRRASGHLSSTIEMLEQGRTCLDVAQQLQAVEKAIQQAKNALIRDHLEAGRLIPLAPPQPTPGRRAYYLLRSASSKRPEVDAFAEWLIELGNSDGNASTETGSQSPSGN